EVAVERGIVTSSDDLSDEQAYALILRPGFSTASEVTGLVGRGVGMDIVGANVAALGGTIEIASRAGHGTTFTIRLPFRTQPTRPPNQLPGLGTRRSGIEAVPSRSSLDSPFQILKSRQ